MMSTTITLQLPEEVAAVVQTPQGMEKAQALITAAFSEQAEAEVRRRAGIRRSAEAVAALFAEWDQEDAALTPEEAEQADKEWEDFQKNMNANRTEVGEDPIY
jgi:hypothetical protein